MFDIQKNYILAEKLFSLVKVLQCYCHENKDVYEVAIIVNVLEDVKILADKLYSEFIEEETEDLNLVDK